MSDPFDMAGGCPSGMVVHRAGSGIVAAPEGIATGPFLVQMLLSSRIDGEMTACLSGRSVRARAAVTSSAAQPRKRKGARARLGTTR